VKCAERYFVFLQRGAESANAASPSAAQENKMSNLSFARIMYGSNEDLHIQGRPDLTSRTVGASGRTEVVSAGESSVANSSVGKLLRFARLFLDGKGQ
jgi:hypothetical protein